MKAFNIRIYTCLMFLLSGSLTKAQFLEKLKPDYAVMQHAGSIGYLSAGAGYDIFKNKRGNIDLNYGNVPESKGGPLHIITTKFAYRPIEVELSDKVQFYPLNPGVFFSYHMGEQFDIAFDKDQYGRGYYGWSTAIRGYLSASNEVKFKTGDKLKSVSLYSEFNASDLYLASLFFKNNRQSLSPQDIIKLGIGLKVGF